jgi:hypothetical protein
MDRQVHTPNPETPLAKELSDVYRSLFNGRMEAIRSRVLQLMDSAFQPPNTDVDSLKAMRAKGKNIIKTLPHDELSLLVLIANGLKGKQAREASQALLDFLSFTAGAISDSQVHRTEPGTGRSPYTTLVIPKTGSGLNVIMQRTETGKVFSYFVNRIDREARDAWLTLTALVPVSPVYKTEEGPKGKTEVTTRFCGPTIAFIESLLDSNECKNLKGIDVMEEIIRQKQNILQTMWWNRIVHNHPHPQNFTVELVRKKYLRESAQKYGLRCRYETDFLNPALVNKIPYREEEFSYDMTDYFKNPNEWQVVVRLIDIDRPRMHTDWDFHDMIDADFSYLQDKHMPGFGKIAAHMRNLEKDFSPEMRTLIWKLRSRQREKTPVFVENN